MLKNNSVIKKFLVVCEIAFVTSCVTSKYFIIQVDALSSNYSLNYNEKKYILLSEKLMSYTSEDLVFKEFANYINFILSQNGFKP